MAGAGLTSCDCNYCRSTLHQLDRLRRRRCPVGVVAQLADHLMERLHLFIGDSGLGDLDQLEHRAKVYGGKESAGVSWLAVSLKGFQAGLFEDGEACTTS